MSVVKTFAGAGYDLWRMEKQRPDKIQKPDLKLKDELFNHLSGIPLPDLDKKQKLLAKIEANSENDRDTILRLRDPEFWHAV